jgi:SAM-dependent methyltransferase
MFAMFSGCQTTPWTAPSSSGASAEAGAQYATGFGSGSPSQKAEPKREPDVIYVPTPDDVVDMMLHLARVSRDDILYDLGCGDGRIVVAAAKKYRCRAFGYDIDPERVGESLENVRENRVRRLVKIEEKDIFTLDLRPATVITLYLLPGLNVRLIPQLEKLRPGCRIVSHDFDMQGVKPDAVLTMDSEEDSTEHTIYLWTTPLKKE